MTPQSWLSLSSTDRDDKSPSRGLHFREGLTPKQSLYSMTIQAHETKFKKKEDVPKQITKWKTNYTNGQ